MGSPENKNPAKTRTRPRMALMAVLVSILIPVLILVALELGLRLAGVGHSPRLFVAGPEEDPGMLHVNHAFTYPFFPQALARAVIPHRIAADKPGETYRIFIFGESAANGDPDPAYGFGRHVEILLEDRFPGTDFEMVNTAITAVNSHVILPIARECAGLDGDLWIIYMGNNEVIGPYGAGTVFGAKAPPLPVVWTSLAVKRTRLGQLMNSAMEGLRGQSGDSPSWGGINMFAQNTLHPEDPARLRVHRNFSRNLEDILRAGRRADVPVLLATVASNLADCAPFASLNDPDLTPERLSAWKNHYESGKALEAAGSHAEALAAYTLAAAIDPGFAELQFRIAHCQRYAGNWTAVRKALVRARDADALAVRADSRINGIIRDAASGHADGPVLLVDVEELLAEATAGGIPGRDLFYEHVHFTLEGNFRVARIFADRIADILPPRIRNSATSGWARGPACQRQLAVTLWDKNRLWTEMGERLSTPPFTARSGNDAGLAHCGERAAHFAARINPRIDPVIYRMALEARPDDYHIRYRYGHYLQMTGALPQAIEQFRWITETFPGFVGGHQELGVALLLADRHAEAQASFERVLDINPAYRKARTALALIRKSAQAETPEGP